MNDLTQIPFRFFKIMANVQAYRNLVYLLVAFPLGVFYFVFLVSGLSTGLSLLIVWVGIPILLLVGAGWWLLASFERLIAIHWLNEDIPAMAVAAEESPDIWIRFWEYLTNPVTWKSLLYLFVKFPLGIATFVIVITLVSLSLAFLGMPFIYEWSEFQVGVFFGLGLPEWRIDSLGEALLGVLVGLLLWPVSLHISNGLAWVHAKFARLMLSVYPGGLAS
jgi:hypothetical protein